jgi:hypothetical protein
VRTGYQPFGGEPDAAFGRCRRRLPARRASKLLASLLVGVVFGVAASGASAAPQLVVSRSALRALGVGVTRGSSGAARADLAAGLPASLVQAVQSAELHSISAAGHGQRLRSDAFAFGSAAVARRVITAWRHARRAHRVVVTGLGFEVSTGSVALVAWREGARVGVIWLHARQSGVAQAALEFARFGDAALFTSTSSYFPLLGNREVFGSTTQFAAVDEAIFTMAPRETRRVTDQLEIRPNDTHPEVDNLIECFDQQGNEIYPPGVGNAPDPDAGIEQTGTNYISHHDVPYQWNISTLIHAPHKNPEENYFCLLEARIDPSYQMTVLAPTTGETKYGTWLEVSTAKGVGAKQVHSSYCNPTGTVETCVYVGGPARLGNQAVEYVPWNLTPLFPERTTPADVWYWTAGDDATTIDGVATIQITECDWETPSCLPKQRGDSGVTNADGESYLDIDQLYPNGSVCQANRAYSEETTPDGQVLLNEGFLSEGFAIPMEQHHHPLYYHISAPVSQTCDGSRTFAVDLYIQWTGGNGVVIDGGNVNVLNSVRAATTTVPDVTGLTEAQADDAIQAAGLTAAATYVNAPGLPNTVLNQNSPGGTVEPAGSPVQITVTRGVVSGPPPMPTALSLQCPQSTVPANKPFPIAGSISPAISGAAITMTYNSSGGGSPVSDTVFTNSSGGFSDTAPGEPPGSVTVDASYGGSSTYAPSQTMCTVQVVTP